MADLLVLVESRMRRAVLSLMLACGFVVASHHVLAQDQVQSGVTEMTPVVRGVVRAPARVVLSTDLSAPIEAVPVSVGQAFEKGDLLIGLDCNRQEAELAAARAEHRAARVGLAQKQHLFRFGAAGKGEVDLASAQTDRAFAQMQVIDAQMRDCAIEAPFSGRVVESFVRPAQRAPLGEPLLTIIDNSDLEIELVVPSFWMQWLEPDYPFDFRLDETGDVLSAYVERLGAEVDPVSQTIKLYARFAEDNARILAGMSGDARFATVPGQALTGSIE